MGPEMTETPKMGPEMTKTPKNGSGNDGNANDGETPLYV